MPGRGEGNFGHEAAHFTKHIGEITETLFVRCRQYKKSFFDPMGAMAYDALPCDAMRCDTFS